MNIMNLFGLEGSSFIISLGLTLLVAGVIMFYCLRRFNMLESSIIEQGRILQSFIMRMQERENSTSQLANDVAINSALNQSITKEDDDKIEVSDNESEYDSDTSSESGSESESDDEKDEKDNKEKRDSQNSIDDSIIDLSLEDHIEDHKCIDISDLNEFTGTSELLITNKSFNILSLENSNLENNVDIVDIETTSSNSDTDDESEKDKLLETLHPNELEKIEKIEKIEKVEKSIMKLKVGELRSLVCDKGIVETMDQAKKISKEELIKMLS